MIHLEYIVEEAGWAVGTIGNGENVVSFDVSYLHDSLKELAESAIEIQEKETKSVIFMAEPGESKLVLSKKEDRKINFELRWYADWASWNIISEDDYEIVLEGKTTIPKYVNQVRKVLAKIMDEIGPIEYRKKWQEHDFPMDEYQSLK